MAKNTNAIMTPQIASLCSVTCHECVMRPISDCPHRLLAAWRGDTADGDIGHGDNSPRVTQSWGNYLNPTGFMQN